MHNDFSQCSNPSKNTWSGLNTPVLPARGLPKLTIYNFWKHTVTQGLHWFFQQERNWFSQMDKMFLTESLYVCKENFPPDDQTKIILTAHNQIARCLAQKKALVNWIYKIILTSSICSFKSTLFVWTQLAFLQNKINRTVSLRFTEVLKLTGTAEPCYFRFRHLEFPIISKLNPFHLDIRFFSYLLAVLGICRFVLFFVFLESLRLRGLTLL